MKEGTFLGRPFGLLGIVVLMGILIFIGGERWRSHQPSPQEHALPGPAAPLPMIRSEAQTFHPPVSAVSVDQRADTDVKVRTLEQAYSLRHYPGAPPRIPHEVHPDIARDMTCNVCHEKGGFTPQFNAYAPITPHPEYANCLQCHVSQSTTETFRETMFAAMKPPALQRPALPGGPPPIPHSIQMRESCLSCHSGPSAPLEIRTTHPERINCRQCHVPGLSAPPFARSAANDFSGEQAPE